MIAFHKDGKPTRPDKRRNRLSKSVSRHAGLRYLGLLLVGIAALLCFHALDSLSIRFSDDITR